MPRSYLLKMASTEFPEPPNEGPLQFDEDSIKLMKHDDVKRLKSARSAFRLQYIMITLRLQYSTWLYFWFSIDLCSLVFAHDVHKMLVCIFGVLFLHMFYLFSFLDNIWLFLLWVLNSKDWELYSFLYHRNLTSFLLFWLFRSSWLTDLSICEPFDCLTN